jgi:hypothetical protein
LSLYEKLKDRSSAIFTYTLTPPSLSSIDAELEKRVNHLKRFIRDVPIDAINIPEVRDENRNRRVTKFDPKIEPRKFAKLLGAHLPEPLDYIVDRGVVYEAWRAQQAWLKSSLQEFEMRNLLLVGGESSGNSYAGPSVEEATRLIRAEYPDFENLTIGAITIPTRRHDSDKIDEPDRLINKSKNGIEYFISQVLFEAESSISLIKDYSVAANKENIVPKRILLSFAPVSTERDIEFLKWWDVLIPEETSKYLLSHDSEILDKSIKVSKSILGKILQFVVSNNIEIPLGINIEHVFKRNLEYAIRLANELYPIYNGYVQEL